MRLNPATNENGSPYTTFNFTVNDGDADSATPNTITVNVTNVNNAPVADNETNSVNEDATLTVTDGASDVLHGDTDADDSASLTVSAIRTGAEGGSGTAGSIGSGLTGTYGTLTLASDGTYTYVADQSAADDLDASDTVTDIFTYTVSDGTATDTGTITITVTGINDAPVAVNDTDAVNEDATVTRSSGDNLLMADDSDADDDDSFTVTQIAVTGSSDNAVTANSTYNSGSPETVTGTYGTLKVGADGTYTYVADQSASDDLDASDTATDSFTYTVSDGNATDTATLIFTVTGVNDVPTASNNTVSTEEDTPYVFSTSDFGYTDADDDDALVSVKITTLESAGALQYYNGSAWVDVTLNQVITATDIAANKLRLNPTADENGSPYTTIGFSVNDGDADSATPNTITVNVTAVNDVPVADDETGAVNEDATLTVTDGTSDVLHGDTDADSDTLTVTTYSHTSATNQSGGSASSGNGNSGTAGSSAVVGYYGTLTLAANGTYTYAADQSAADDLDASDTVTDIFTYTVSDGTATDTATITITVTGVNDAPVAVDDTDAVNEDATVTRSSGDSLLMADDSDADDDDSFTVTQIAVTGGSNSSVTSSSSYNSSGTQVTGTYGTLTVGADGTYTYVADQSASDDLDLNDTATDSFTYTVSDGTATDTATLIFTVTGVNDAPVAVDDTDAVNEDATVTRSSGDNLLMADDSDADDDDSFTVTQIGVTGGSNSSVAGSSTYNNNFTSVTGTYGTLKVGADGTYTYVADQSAADDLDATDTATDSFTYTVSDGTATDTATLIFTVTGINDAPVADNETGAVNEDATLTVTDGTSDVLHGDTDADDSASLTVSAIRTGAEGGSGTSGSIGSGLTGSYGTLTLASDGTYTYVADQSAADDLDASDTVTDIFTYTVSDGTATDTGTITITVTGINDAPVAVNDTDAVNEDATVTRSSGDNLLMADDSDADDDDAFTVTQIAVTGGSNNAVTANSTYNSGSPETVTGTYGTLKVGADGTYTYVADQSASDDLDASDTATDSFTYTVSDGDATDTATLIFTITGVNDVPTASNNTVSTEEDTPYVFSTSDFGYTDADDDDALVSVKITTLEDAGALQYNNGSAWVDVTLNQVITATDIAANKLRLNPATNENGSSYTTFNFTVNDGDASSSTPNTITVNVTAVNDTPTATDDTASVNEDATTTISSASSGVIDDNDTDPDSSDTLTLTNVAHTNGNTESVTSSTTYLNGQSITGTYGTLTVGADGTYTYAADQSAADDLDASDTATDVFTYTLSDGTATDTATITITVTGVNDAPAAVNDTDAVNEDATVTRSSGDNLLMADDSDADDDDSFTVTQIAVTGSSDNAVTANSTYNSGSPETVTGTYGTLTVGANGTYTYVADQSAADDLDLNDQVTDSFTYTVSDGTATDTATLIFTVTGINDAPVADNETNSVNEDATLTVTDGTSDVLYEDTDADDSASLTVSAIRTGAEGGSGTAGSIGSGLTGTYGTLTLASDGTYTYVADQSAADDLDASDTATDVFTYTVSDGTATDTGTITITVTGINDAPVAVNDTDAVNEDATVTRSSGQVY